MIRFTLLQARLQIILSVLGLAFVGVALMLTSQDIAGIVNTCGSNLSTCDSVGEVLPPEYAQLYLLMHALVLITPGLIGVFWGAPLVAKEFSDATQRVVWTQSVTRTRWIVTKLATLGLLAMGTSALLSWMVGAWTHETDDFATFDARDIVPVAHTAFAFVVGVVAGLFIKRVVPAMVTTLILVVVFSIGGPNVRPHLVAPLERTASVNEESMHLDIGTDDSIRLTPIAQRIPNALVVTTELVDKSGNSASSLRFDANSVGACADVLTALRQTTEVDEEAFSSARNRCYAAVDTGHDIHIVYQPASRYWMLQWIESGLYMALAFALSVLCVVYLRRYAA
jgi:ABC-type transport system involved in multi-copper enzyme maturation permease subunit